MVKKWFARLIDWTGKKQDLQKRQAELDSRLAQLQVAANQIEARYQSLLEGQASRGITTQAGFSKKLRVVAGRNRKM